MLVHEKRSESGDVYIDSVSGLEIERTHSIPQNVFEEWDEYIINPYLTPDILSIWDSVNGNSIQLGQFTEINQAIALKHDRDDWIHNEKREDNYKPVIDGRDISRYHIDWTNKYIEYDDSAIHSCKRTDIFEADEKLFFRRVGRGIVACYDDEQFYALNTLVAVNLLESVNDIEPEYILALLNSKFINWYFEVFLKSTKEIFSEIQARQVERIPVPIPEFKKSEKDEPTEFEEAYVEYISPNSTVSVGRIIQTQKDDADIFHNSLVILASKMKEYK